MEATILPFKKREPGLGDIYQAGAMWYLAWMAAYLSLFGVNIRRTTK